MDIDLSLLDPVAKAYPDVTFIQGDSLEIDKCFPPELLQVRKSIAICAKMSIFWLEGGVFQEMWVGHRREILKRWPFFRTKTIPKVV